MRVTARAPASPKFITFEGTEGAGKSTLIREVAQRLRLILGHDPIQTREPGGSATAEKIRNLILNEEMDPRTELFLYEAARAEHLARTIRPALKAGKWVLCDRFADSSLAYQAHARGLPWKEVLQANRLATQGLDPDLTVLLDIDPAKGLARAQVTTRFEAEGVEFQKKVRLGFMKARRENPKRWLVLKVEKGSPAELADFVTEYLRKKFIK
jgi:dTMP kinase